MKHLFPILAAFFLGATISITVIACAEDDATNAPVPAMPQTMEELQAYVLQLNAKVEQQQTEIELLKQRKYQPNIKEMYSYTEGKGFSKWIFSYGEDGKINKITDQWTEEGYGSGTDICPISYSDNVIRIGKACEITLSEEDIKDPQLVNAVIFAIGDNYGWGRFLE